MNCMSVFHYVANQLQGEPIFDTDVDQPQIAQNQQLEGAIYNDFDFQPMLLMHDDYNEHFSFSQQQADNHQPSSASDDQAIIEALDHAIMSAEKTIGVLYEHLPWESPLFDNSSDECDS